MKKETLKKKLTLNKKTIQVLTKASLNYVQGGGTVTCPSGQTCLECLTSPQTGCNGLSPQTMCVGGTTVTISVCNTGNTVGCGGSGKC